MYVFISADSIPSNPRNALWLFALSHGCGGALSNCTRRRYRRLKSSSSGEEGTSRQKYEYDPLKQASEELDSFDEDLSDQEFVRSFQEINDYSVFFDRQEDS